MFDNLRKKLSDAVKGFIKREERKSEEQAEQQPAPQIEEEKEGKETQEEATAPEEHGQESIEEHDPGEQGIVAHEKGIIIEETPHAPAAKDERPAEKQRQEPKKGGRKNEDIIKLSLTTKIKKAFMGSIKLNESEIRGFLDTLRIDMLESDVSYGTTEQFIDDLDSKLKNRQIQSRQIKEEITRIVRESLFSVLYIGNALDIDMLVDGRKASGNLPVKILFLGPNGAGKTTTIAKIAYHFKQKGISNVLSASDTFRAAAIEQIEHHANKIGVPVIKSKYGADPASIAFDAIAYARSHSIDLVLIDSAGRQETNRNLISEMEKMVRVSKPDVIVFVGESISGNQIAQQILEFSKHIKIDGIILTKLDCDAKGGGALSISHTTGIPILYFGTGEKYDALMKYDPNYIVDAILPQAG